MAGRMEVEGWGSLPREKKIQKGDKLTYHGPIADDRK
jgi:hypothetical protein